jgi:acetylornithine deacetylase/succinyl-diaminopimelate desuccinylase-like protein
MAAKVPAAGLAKPCSRCRVRSSAASAPHIGGLPVPDFAIREIARHILELEAMTNFETGTTVNVGGVNGGTLLNMVPAKARIEIDLRVPDEETGRRLVDTIVTRQPFDPDVRLEIEGGLNRPPFLAAPASDACSKRQPA